MAILYVDLVSGDDSTGDGSAGNPYLTVDKALTIGSGDDIRVAKTTAATEYTGVGDMDWEINSYTITTASDLQGTINVGDYIGKSSAAGNGAHETFYKVASITASSITLEMKYYGDTETVTSFKIQPIITTGALNATAITITVAASISGGWNLTTETRDGETWFTNNAPRASTYYAIYHSSSDSPDITYLNMVDCWAIFRHQTNVNGGQLSNCTMHGYRSCIYRNGYWSNCSLLYCVFTSITSITWYCYSQNIYVKNCLWMNNYSNMITPAGASSATPWEDNVVFGYTSGLYFDSANTTWAGNNVFYYCSSIALYNIYNNQIISNCTFNNCGSCIQSSSLNGGITVRDCTFNNCGTGMRFYQSHGNIMQNCTFNNCNYAAYIDNYSGTGTFEGCTANGINSAFIYKDYRSGLAIIKNCTIDAGSVDKLLVVPTPGLYPMLHYICENSGGKNGRIWGCGAKMLDNTTYRTTSPSLAITWNATTTKNETAMKIMSSMVNLSTSKTFSFYMQTSNTSWAGTLGVQWRLNGTVVKAESDITSLNTSWTQYSYNIASGLVTESGELSLEFVPNMNTYQINVDDMEVS